MKKLLMFIPLVLFVVFTTVSYKFVSLGTMKPVTMVFVMAVLMIGMAIFRPKTGQKKPNPEAISKALGDFAKDAFNDDSKLSATFHSAVKDFSGNMPKSAISKLGKLAPQCRTDEEKYAVAMVSALAQVSVNNYEQAIREYNRAVVIHPTSELAQTIGSCQQRIGELKKARESYEFALELDPNNIEARASMATAWVASRKYENALEHAMLALELDEHHASALATAAICYGLTGDNLMYKQYTDLAEDNGYSRKKIEDTVKALKKD